MKRWLWNSFTQFACGVVAGAATFVMAWRGLKFFSTYYAFWKREADVERDGEIALDDSEIFSGLISSSDEGFYNLGFSSRVLQVGRGNVRENDVGRLVDMLFDIAVDQAHREGFIHRGITCNVCGSSPIYGTRYKCANCNDYDVCEACEPTEYHNRTHVFLKIKYPIPPLANPKTACLKPFYPGRNVNIAPLDHDTALNLEEETFFNESEILALFEQFKTLVPETQGITREAFNQCLGPLAWQSNLVMDRMFLFYDQNEDGFISFEEFVCALSILVKGSQVDKLRYVFAGYDVEKKGYLDRDDFHDMFKAFFNISIELVRDYVKTCEEEIKASFDEAADRPVSSAFQEPIPRDSGGTSSQNFDIKSLHQLPSHSATASSSSAQPLMEAMSQDAIDEMVENVFNSADLDQDGKITFEEFQTWVSLDKTVLNWFHSLGTVF